MLSLTKQFRFEAAHAILGYPGACAQIHGHSYALQVTVKGTGSEESYLPGLGMILDFKNLKKWVQGAVIDQLDHAFMVSKAYAQLHPERIQAASTRVFPFEPTAENLLIYIKTTLQATLPSGVLLYALRLHETADSFAEWVAQK